MSNLLTSVGNGLRRALGFVVGAALLAVVILVCIQVFSRYFIGAPTPGLAEISRLLFIWMTFLGAALLISRRELIVIDLLHDRLRSGILERLQVFVDVATAVFLLVLVFYTRHLMIVVGQKIAPATGVSFAWYYGGLLAFSIIGLVFIAERLFGTRRVETTPPADTRKPAVREEAGA
jgi:TRAP-type C4-dicarboxylate transport system permease small subunit